MCLFMKVNNFNSLYAKFTIRDMKIVHTIRSELHTTRVNNESQFHAVSYELDLTLIIVPASCGSSQTCSLLYLKKVRYLLHIYPLFHSLKFFLNVVLIS